MADYTTDELREAIRPIASLIAKSEKAQRKLASGTWQHARLGDNLKALRMAAALMTPEADRTGSFAPDDLQAARLAIAAMLSKTEKAQARFPPGSSQHSLLTNRLRALKMAEALIGRALDEQNA